ncbi:MAG: hypothetical protein KBT00_05625 [Bacteroidales bacterium]|nr:hypothetical protein [Candidatus Cacconaster merdequi]
MNSRFAHILFVIILFLFQIVISDYLNLGLFVYLCLIPLIILSLPLQQRTSFLMLEAFLAGMLLDMASDGVPGINASAAVLIAFLRKPLYKFIARKDRQDRTEFATQDSIGISKYLALLTVMTALYLLVYNMVDCIGVRTMWFILLKTLCSTVTSTAVAFILSRALSNKH